MVISATVHVCDHLPDHIPNILNIRNPCLPSSPSSPASYLTPSFSPRSNHQSPFLLSHFHSPYPSFSLFMCLIFLSSQLPIPTMDECALFYNALRERGSTPYTSDKVKLYNHAAKCAVTAGKLVLGTNPHCSGNGLIRVLNTCSLKKGNPTAYDLVVGSSVAIESRECILCYHITVSDIVPPPKRPKR